MMILFKHLYKFEECELDFSFQILIENIGEVYGRYLQHAIPQ